MAAPVASFDVSPSLINRTGGLFTFADTSTNTPTSWSWDFGDGSPPDTAQNPTHRYQSAGQKTVTLTVTNADGSSTTSTVVIVAGPTKAINGATITTLQSVDVTAPSQCSGLLNWSVENGAVEIVSVSSDTLTCTVRASGSVGRAEVTARTYVGDGKLSGHLSVEVVSPNQGFAVTPGTPTP